MRKIVLLIILSCSLVSSSGQTFTINGRLSKLHGTSKIYLIRSVDDLLAVDSSVTSNGEFQFSGETKDPIRAMLVLDHDSGHVPIDFSALPANADTKLFVLAPGVTKIQGQDYIRKAKAISPLGDLEDNYNSSLGSVEKPIRQISKAYRKASETKKNDPAFQQQIALRYQVATEAKKLLQAKYISEHPDSYFSLEAVEEMAGIVFDPDQIEPIFNKLSARVRNTERGKAFAEEIATVRRLNQGLPAPDFALNEVNTGRLINLSDYLGKTVLLEFWASWYNPCRYLHQILVPIFQEYKDRNFVVLSVSVDPPADRKWLLDAIKEDSLPWINLADPARDKNVAARLYNIKLIPQSFLIDSTGKIVQKDLKGEALRQQLDSLLPPAPKSIDSFSLNGVLRK